MLLLLFPPPPSLESGPWEAVLVDCEPVPVLVPVPLEPLGWVVVGPPLGPVPVGLPPEPEGLDPVPEELEPELVGLEPPVPEELPAVSVPVPEGEELVAEVVGAFVCDPPPPVVLVGPPEPEVCPGCEALVSVAVAVAPLVVGAVVGLPAVLGLVAPPAVEDTLLAEVVVVTPPSPALVLVLVGRPTVTMMVDNLVRLPVAVEVVASVVVVELSSAGGVMNAESARSVNSDTLGDRVTGSEEQAWDNGERGIRKGREARRTCALDGHHDGVECDLAREVEAAVGEIDYAQSVQLSRVEVRERKECVLSRGISHSATAVRSRNTRQRSRAAPMDIAWSHHGAAVARATKGQRGRRLRGYERKQDSPEAPPRSLWRRARRPRRCSARGRSSMCSPRTQSTAPRARRGSPGRTPRTCSLECPQNEVARVSDSREERMREGL